MSGSAGTPCRAAEMPPVQGSAGEMGGTQGCKWSLKKKKKS